VTDPRSTEEGRGRGWHNWLLKINGDTRCLAEVVPHQRVKKKRRQPGKKPGSIESQVFEVVQPGEEEGGKRERRRKEEKRGGGRGERGGERRERKKKEKKRGV